MRLVLDTDVVVAALRSDRGASRRLLTGALDRAFEVLASVPLPRVRSGSDASGHLDRQWPDIAGDERSSRCSGEGIGSGASPVFVASAAERSRRRDGAGDSGQRGGHWLVTFNVRHLAVAAREFGIRVMRPCDAWKEMRKHARSNVALRLQESILEEARRVSETEGVALNQFINVAVAEKLSALRTEEYFRLRGQRAMWRKPSGF